MAGRFALDGGVLRDAYLACHPGDAVGIPSHVRAGSIGLVDWALASFTVDGRPHRELFRRTLGGRWYPQGGAPANLGRALSCRLVRLWQLPCRPTKNPERTHLSVEIAAVDP
jgi:hypothetical protein